MSDQSRAPFPWGSVAVAIAASLVGVAALDGWVLRADVPIESPLGPIAFSASDGLSGAFLLLAGLVGLAASFAGRRERLDRTGRILVGLFLLGLVAVPLAADTFTFLAAWELMSATPGVLLLLDPRPATRRAGLVYLAYSQMAAVALLSGLLVWNNGRDGTFDTLLSSPPPTAAVLLLLLGAALKAGVMPFHTWLPEAHPAAPSHVSAMMSGVMVSLPSYLLLRLVVPHHAVPAWAATTLLLLGASSTALASLHALHERNLKRLLALTTVAHMGVLASLVALGEMVPRDADPDLERFLVTTVAAYALAHGLAKGALFLVAGEIHHATGELDLERLGGLWRRMGALALVGGLAGLALSGLPPFGGFPAELSVFTSVFAALPLMDSIQGVSVLGAVFLLGIGAGAGLAAVAKFILGTFHGLPRGDRLAQPGRRTGSFPAAFLLAGSLALGLAPGLLWGGLPAGAPDPWTLSTPVGGLRPALTVATALALLIVVALLARSAPRPRRAPQWNAGAPPPTPRQTYTPQALVMPYRILFAEILKPTSDLRLQDAPVAPFGPSKGQYDDPEHKFIEPWVHEPLLHFLAPKIERLRRFHRGPVQSYLIVALLVLVLLLFLMPVIR